ncbi:hypothetical protein EYF80_061110 [Liparis tanakae]|uniref:Uncharacterized protein n=1 Tax=Liparis tanakae TaxID=230148 RepID=A0A4Z2EJI1_9TELE|nr:hypothetical protein EYF80_061110 [Liparis tanakae]
MSCLISQASQALCVWYSP